MHRTETSLPGVFLLEPKIWRDDRGYLFEAYHQAAFEKLGIAAEFVQDNVSFSVKGVLRGLHYQVQQPQAKLLRCVRGKVFDVVADIRRGSPTFGQWFGCELSEENNLQLFIPIGCAHGFYTLSDDAEVYYKCSDFYYPKGQRTIAWNDPDLAIEWPLLNSEPIMSEKDRAGKPLAQAGPDDLLAFEV